MTWITLLDYFGLVVFAISGCMVAAEKRLDIIGFVFFAVATGIGGGTLRDIVLGRLPVFWVQDATPLVLCAGVAAICFFLAHRIHNYRRALLWADALGMATFSVIGTQVAYAMGVSWPVCILMGIFTASFGGVLRDVIAQHPSVILMQDIYITAAFLGGGMYLLLLLVFQWDAAVSAAVGLLSAFVLRGMAIRFNLQLPAFASSSHDIRIK